MSRFRLRESIAIEAARLIVRGKESGYATARKRAARWLSRRRLDADDLPSNAEIETQIYALSGLFADENQPAALRGMRETALDLMQLLEPLDPRVVGCAVDGPVTIGSEIVLVLSRGSVEDVKARLRQSGIHAQERDGARPPGIDSDAPGATLRFHYRYPCEVRLPDSAFAAGLSDSSADAGLDAAQLGELLRESRPAETEPVDADDADAVGGEHEYHPDTFAMLKMLLERLESVRLDSERHPEGDALYHSLQVYELGLEERPYDEEFLLACLLHDAGLAIDRRDPVGAALAALTGLVTPRTCFLIEHRPAAVEYLRSGRIARSLRRSEHFDDLVLLARCDRAGRVAGARVGTVDEALDYIAGLGAAWDDA